MENLFDLFLHGFLGVLVTHFLVGDGVFEVDVLGNQVPSGNQVVIVDDLHESLDARPPLDLLGAHALGHLQGVPLDASHQSVRKLLVLKSHINKRL